jgi:hypothetical protein
MLVHSEKLSKLWELDVLGIRNPSGRKSNEEEKTAVQAYFLYKVKMNDDRRYEVRLPWIEGHPPVPRYFYLAKKRVENVLRKLEEKISELHVIKFLGTGWKWASLKRYLRRSGLRGSIYLIVPL